MCCELRATDVSFSWKQRDCAPSGGGSLYMCCIRAQHEVAYQGERGRETNVWACVCHSHGHGVEEEQTGLRAQHIHWQQAGVTLE